ncbi:MAG: phage virion morphogenesis protein [Bacteroidota bacterium]|nr:phage virion morphogenesis protein [Bacteroidota bacterium]
MDIEKLKQYLTGEVKRKVDIALGVIETFAPKAIHKNFEKGGRPVPWKPSQKKGKNKGTKTLVVTGTLSNVSATRNGSDLSVTLSVDPRSRAYARIHQEGGTIHMPTRTLRFREKKYKSGETRTVFASKRHKRIKMEKTSKPYVIKMPPRPFMVIPEEDINKMRSEIEKKWSNG